MKFGKGSVHSQVAKDKMSKAHLGKKHSKKARAKMSKVRCPRGHLMSKTRKKDRNGGTYCSACKKIRLTEFRKSDLGRIKTKGYNRKAKLKAVHGMTESDFQALLSQQDGKCAICLREPDDISRFHIDHDHKTGTRRGILCHYCNTAIGSLGEDRETIFRALAYLEKHACTS